jgi:hypothetical protein
MMGHCARHCRRVGEVAKLFADTSIITIVSFISPYRRDRDAVRARTPQQFIEVRRVAQSGLPATLKALLLGTRLLPLLPPGAPLLAAPGPPYNQPPPLPPPSTRRST